MRQHPLRIIVVGGTGYTGAELLRLAAGHPQLEIAGVVGNKTAGQDIAAILPSLRGLLDGRVEAFDPDRVAKDADAAFCALPHAASADVVASLRERGQTVFDLSADFRFADLTTYEKWYGPHPAPGLLSEATYGLVELHREALRAADLVAVPGCYPTSAILALAPLLKADLIDTDGIVVDAKSGVSGAGRAVGPATHFSEVAEGLRAYKVGAHRHAPEIDKELSAVAESSVRVTFVPHLVPMTRGIHATCYARPSSSNRAPAQCIEAAKALYANSPSVVVLDEGQHPDTLWVRGSNRVYLGYAQDPSSRTVVAMSVIDNLVKGAAGQAIQCLNVRFGLDEGTGLSSPAVWP
jgi:N-acetyl-gamma-glutamyl-phosphate reductase